MARIETGLHAHHAAAQAAQSQPLPATVATPSVPGGSNATDTNLIETPFAVINSVVPASPAEGAGLKAGDRIRNFGGINWLNHEKLSKVATTVQRNEGVSLVFPTIRDCLLIRGCRTALYQSQDPTHHIRGWTIARNGATARAEARLGRSGFARLPSFACLMNGF